MKQRTTYRCGLSEKKKTQRSQSTQRRFKSSLFTLPFSPCSLCPPCLRIFNFFLGIFFLLVSCTFDYGTQDDGYKGLPDIVMESVEYVRMRSADPQARFQAERLERFEERRIMDLVNFSFEQYGNRGEEVNAYGRAGSGSMEIDSGDIRMDNMVRIEIETEDIIIETVWLEWRDRDRTLIGGDTEEVIIQQQNGTTFTGFGFRANARYRTWEFSGHVEGTFIHEEDEEEESAEAESTGAETETEESAGNNQNESGMET